ncbi:MAG: hypothetical protein HQL06_06140 [Nitrospirae bacterium]|nr:hypothetical protein [Nitrospirota bacterium]
MRKIVLVMVFSLLVVAVSQVFADEYDLQWISKCLEDNKREGQSNETVMKYCKCMNDKMSSDETRSITEWEKTHKKEMAECDRVAGWK